MEWDRASNGISEEKEGNKSAEKQTHWGERASNGEGEEGRGVGRSSEVVHYFSLTRIFCTQCAFENGVPASLLKREAAHANRFLCFRVFVSATATRQA